MRPGTGRAGIGRSPDGRPRRVFGILGRVISFVLLVVGALAVVVGAIARPVLGRWIDKRNIERLRLRYSLDQETAEELYRQARRHGFGAAWKTVIEGPARRTNPAGQTRPAAPTTGRTRDRRLAGRHRA
jgi:type II secretory pathway pseudopilin PulG